MFGARSFMHVFGLFLFCFNKPRSLIDLHLNLLGSGLAAAHDSRYASLAGDAVGTTHGRDKRRASHAAVPSRCGSGGGVAGLPRYGSRAAEAVGCGGGGAASITIKLRGIKTPWTPR